ncbi:hypothetical protein L484_027527 [Morus notabilis]|uniref:Uncharacterized protein n=1 Tax=Morus notabilis TaxID=981085 RepID=W9RYB9_9ROSA|nr:hypothetical protein L484_027527 [Morus notabilis]
MARGSDSCPHFSHNTAARPYHLSCPNPYLNSNIDPPSTSTTSVMVDNLYWNCVLTSSKLVTLEEQRSND